MIALRLLPAILALFGAPQTQKPPFEDEILKFEAEDATKPPPKHAIEFTGSSSIRMWTNLKQDFPDKEVFNRGFGGSQIADSVRLAPRTVFPYEPRMIVFYAGTNDIAAGKTADTVFDDYTHFVDEVHAKLPRTRIAFISLSPVPSRWNRWSEMSKANSLVLDYTHKHKWLTYIDIVPVMLDDKGQPRPELFRPDMLHMNLAGYVIWTKAIAPYLAHA